MDWKRLWLDWQELSVSIYLVGITRWVYSVRQKASIITPRTVFLIFILVFLLQFFRFAYFEQKNKILQSICMEMCKIYISYFFRMSAAVFYFEWAWPLMLIFQHVGYWQTNMTSASTSVLNFIWLFWAILLHLFSSFFQLLIFSEKLSIFRPIDSIPNTDTGSLQLPILIDSFPNTDAY